MALLQQRLHNLTTRATRGTKDDRDGPTGATAGLGRGGREGFRSRGRVDAPIHELLEERRDLLSKGRKGVGRRGRGEELVQRVWLFFVIVLRVQARGRGGGFPGGQDRSREESDGAPEKEGNEKEQPAAAQAAGRRGHACVYAACRGVQRGQRVWVWGTKHGLGMCEVVESGAGFGHGRANAYVGYAEGCEKGQRERWERKLCLRSGELQQARAYVHLSISSFFLPCFVLLLVCSSAS